MRSRETIGLPVLCMVACIVPVIHASTDVLLGRGDTLLPWQFAGPGQSSLSLSSAVTPWSGLPYLNISYDFSQGGWVATVSLADSIAAAMLNIPASLGIAFSVYNPGEPMNLVVDIVQQGGQTLGSWPYIESGWSNLSISFNASNWSPSPSDGVQLPLQQITIGANKQPAPHAIGWIGIADVYILTNATPGTIPNAVLVDLIQPMGIGDGVIISGTTNISTALGVQVTNRLGTSCSANITVQMRNCTGSMGEGAGGFDSWIMCASNENFLSPWTTTNFTCDIPGSTPPGFVVMKAWMTASSCWTANDTAQLLEGGVAVLSPRLLPPAVVRNNHTAVFGGQMTSSPAAAAAIGMLTVRHQPLWRWAQPYECWNLSTCFDWSFYDGAFPLSAAGIELMIDAREIAPPWAAAKNDSGPTWASFPGPLHYSDYQHYLTLMLDRYGGMSTAVEVSNEDDGLAYFMPYAIDMNSVDIPLSLALINLTAAAMQASPNASNLKLVGLSSSMFDVKQEGNGGSTYMYYEQAILSAPGVINQLDAVSVHPYQNQVWVPWTQMSWGNLSFQYPNETLPGTNSTVAQLLATAGLMKQEAEAAGLGPEYHPVLWPSEWGYNLLMTVSATEGWIMIHAALVAQGLLHMRSAPLAQYVQKAFYFAVYDGCCAEQNGFYGLWRPVQLRTGPNATLPGQQPQLLPDIMPLPSVAAYATASLMIDVPSGRLAGVFVVDNTANGGDTSLPPSCVAFEPDPSTQPPVAPLVVVFTLGHHFNDRTAASLQITTSTPANVTAINGLGSPLPLNITSADTATTYQISISVSPLPQYILLPADTTAVQVCASITW